MNPAKAKDNQIPHRLGSTPILGMNARATPLLCCAAHGGSSEPEKQPHVRAEPLHILHLEDNSADRELVGRMLAKEGLHCQIICAATKAQFEDALVEKTFDIILSDFSLPCYNGLSALAAATCCQPGVPFVFVSGTIGEERAVDGLKSGATDYVLKDRLVRLGPAVRRALKEAGEATRRHQLEEQLRQAQKLEAIGRLVGGVAHDFNNLLTIIGGNAELLSRHGEAMSGHSREWLEQIISASERAAALTRQLLAFGRKQTLQPQALDLNQAIAELTRLLGRVIGDDIRLCCQLSSQPAFLYADRGMMEQVLMNLVVNARDAMPQGGDLIIKTEPVTLDEACARSYHSEGRAGEFILLSVTDTGTGIRPEHLSRIFEPFFTTKEIGKGTGLGLATAHGIVTQHQGWIEVFSALNQGTVFHTYLPAIAPPAAGAAQILSEAEVRGGDETILLVEDEAPLRQFAASVLGELGYQVLEAPSGKVALELWQGNELTVDLLLTDMMMPEGVTGIELASRLRKAKPDLKVIFSSGYSSESLRDATPKPTPPPTVFLQKPYSPRLLAKVVRQCLDEIETVALGRVAIPEYISLNQNRS